MAEYITFQPSDYFSTILYTGDGGASQAQTGVGFSADLTWIKSRDSTEEHVWTDTVRGATYWIRSNSTNAQGSIASLLQSWQSDGFTVGNNGVVGTTDDYVAWNWKAGTTTGIDTTGSTITPSSYSFNATSGFSIVQYTGNDTAGAKVPHGLGVAPDLVIVKTLGGANSWVVYHQSMGATKYMYLDTTAAEASSTTRWNDTAPDSVNVTLGSGGNTNGSGGDSPLIMYSFAGKKGFSSFNSYTGNGNSNGPTVYTGFKPSFLLIKRFDATLNNWVTKDNARDTFNPVRNYIYPNLSNAGTNIGPPATAGGYEVDFYGTGFKIKTSDGKWNDDGGQYIYIAFGQTIVGDNGVVATTYA